jgi:hypothetical protein
MFTLIAPKKMAREQDEDADEKAPNSHEPVAHGGAHP